MNVYPFIAAEQAGKLDVKGACELLKVYRLTPPLSAHGGGGLLPRTEAASAPLQQFIDEVAALVGAPCAGISLILNDASPPEPSCRCRRPAPAP